MPSDTAHSGMAQSWGKMSKKYRLSFIYWESRLARFFLNSTTNDELAIDNSVKVGQKINSKTLYYFHSIVIEARAGEHEQNKTKMSFKSHKSVGFVYEKNCEPNLRLSGSFWAEK